jgi:hypothetical protein
MKHQSKNKYVCPVCEREVDDAIIPFHKNVEKQILEVIKTHHPRWIESDGTCPKAIDYYKALIEHRMLK